MGCSNPHPHCQVRLSQPYMAESQIPVSNPTKQTRGRDVKGNLPGLVPKLFFRGNNPMPVLVITPPRNCSLCLTLSDFPPGGSTGLQMAGAPLQL